MPKFSPKFRSGYAKILREQYEIQPETKTNESFRSNNSDIGYRIGPSRISNQTKNELERLRKK